MIIFNWLIKRYNVFNASRELKRYSRIIKRESENVSIDDLISLVYDKYERFFNIKQVRSEITDLCNFVKDKNLNCILEIGTASGGSLFLLSKLLSKNGTIISIDLPEGLFGGGYPSYKPGFYKSFVEGDQKMHLLRGDSHANETYNSLKELLGDVKVDLLFIDGDHSYEGVKRDFNIYREIVAEGGIIMLHDVAPHKKDSLCKVNLFWEELKPEFEGATEFIENWNQNWAGIGVVYNSRKNNG